MRWAAIGGASAQGVLVLAFSLATGTAAFSQPPRQGPAPPLDPRSATSLADFLGPWVRNAGLSDDPVDEANRAWRNEKAVSTDLRASVAALGRSLDTVMIRNWGSEIFFLDSTGTSGPFPLNGKETTLGGRAWGRAYTRLESLHVETTDSSWRRVETFSLKGDTLVRLTHLDVVSRPLVEFRSVYDRPAVNRVPHEPTQGGDVPEAVRIVPPFSRYGELLSGQVEVQTLIIDSSVHEVEFFLDDRRVKRVRKRPFRTRIALADPPREQRLEVLAYNEEEDFLGRHEMVLNQTDRPFAVRIAQMHSAPVAGGAAIRVAALVSLPRATALEQVDFYRSDSFVERVTHLATWSASDEPREIAVEGVIEDARPSDYIRVVAKLADGREREDAKLLQGADYQGEIDIQLVQIQVLVTDRDGTPVGGLSPSDFEIRENGRIHEAVGLHTAHDVPLVLGLAIDSSDSMLTIWGRLMFIARGFLESALRPGDRSFLVDFDHTVRLVQAMTGDHPLLSRRLDNLVPLGGTALNDGLLFSLLQYGQEPGRRALVVVTDGADQHSRSRPEQSANFAERLGLPIYFLELDASTPATDRGNHEFSVGVQSSAATQRSARRRLSRIGEQTGGHLFQVQLSSAEARWIDRVEQAFAQIEEELRHQHLLTYYSNQPPGAPITPEVRVTRRGLKLRSAVPLVGIE